MNPDSLPTVWWILCGALIVAELTTGTFYLLMLALGAAAGAVASHSGVGIAAQMATAAMVGSLTTVGWHLIRYKAPKSRAAHANANVHLDIGNRVRVDAWAPDGVTRVGYRGATWEAHFVAGSAGLMAPAPGDFVIVSVEGTALGLSPVSAPSSPTA